MTDLADAARAWRLWTLMAWHDLKQQYSRAYLGLLWIPVFTGLYVLVLTFVFARLNQVPPGEFAIYVGTGLIVWQFASEVIIESAGVFQQTSMILQNSIAPRSLGVFRLVQRNLFRLLFNLLVLVSLYLIYGVPTGFDPVALAFGIFSLALVAFPTALFAGLIGLRFPDVRLMISFGIRIMFFATPIVWKPERLGEYAHLVYYNPFYHCIEVARSPAEGEAFPLVSIAIVGCVGLVTSVTACGLFLCWRDRLAQWV